MKSLYEIFKKQLISNPVFTTENKKKECSNFGNEFKLGEKALLAVFKNIGGSIIQIAQISERDWNYILYHYDLVEEQGNGVPIFVEKGEKNERGN